MPEPLADEQLAAWEALCDRATPGPWVSDPLWADAIRFDAGTRSIVLTREAPNDVAFIAAARSALPLLLAEVRRLRARKE